MKLMSTSLARARRAMMLGLAACAIIAAGVGAIPAGPVFAAPEPPAATAPAQVQGERLERLLKREQRRLEYEQRRLAHANERAGRIQQRIDTLKSQGKDTAKLEAALANFKKAIATAQTHFDTAKRILDAKAGFDANGKVTNVDQARTTLRDTARAERQFSLTVRKAVRELLRELREYLRGNAPRHGARGPR